VLSLNSNHRNELSHGERGKPGCFERALLVIWGKSDLTKSEHQRQWFEKGTNGFDVTYGAWAQPCGWQ